MSTTIGGGRYNRMPTRYRLHLIWMSVGTGLAVWEYLKLTVLRVQPKREEDMYVKLQEQYGDNIPPHVLDQVQSLREMRENLNIHSALATPTPGQFTSTAARDMDFRRLGELRR